jgi:hypothetical protein
MTAEVVTHVRSRIVTLGVEGAPNAANRYGPGHMRPTQVQITYWYDKGSVEPEPTVRVFGMWTRENGEQTDHVMDQSWLARDWPNWLVGLVQANKP